MLRFCQAFTKESLLALLPWANHPLVLFECWHKYRLRQPWRIDASNCRCHQAHDTNAWPHRLESCRKLVPCRCGQKCDSCNKAHSNCRLCKRSTWLGYACNALHNPCPLEWWTCMALSPRVVNSYQFVKGFLCLGKNIFPLVPYALAFFLSLYGLVPFNPLSL